MERSLSAEEKNAAQPPHEPDRAYRPARIGGLTRFQCALSQRLFHASGPAGYAGADGTQINADPR